MHTLNCDELIFLNIFFIFIFCDEGAVGRIEGGKDLRDLRIRILQRKESCSKVLDVRVAQRW
jgi:hypothetical protein